MESLAKALRTVASKSLLVLICILPLASAQMPPPIFSAADALRRSESIQTQHGALTSADGTCLFFRYWPSKIPKDRVALVLHGIGFESAPYHVVADALNPRGIDVYALDARGHGLSCGSRNQIGTPRQVAQDVSAMAELIRAHHPAVKLYLVNDSMGCNFALDYAKDHGDQLSGVVLLAPPLGISSKQIFQLNTLLVLPYILFAHHKAAINLVGHRLDQSSRDAQFIADRRSDPLAYKKVSFSYLLGIRRLTHGWKRGIAPEFRTPLLVVQGRKDEIVNQKDALAFGHLAVASDKRLQTYPDVYHTTLWDPKTPEILESIGDWILAH